MPENGHVFISYSRRDGNDAATKLENALKTERFSYWRDIRDINPHKDFTAEIEKNIERASHVVVCITPDSKREDSYVRREIQYAILSGKPVIPLRFADVIPHLSIVNFEWIDLFVEWDTPFARLCGILRSDAHAYKDYAVGEDPFRPYLEHLYKRIVDYLDQVIIREIELDVEPSPESVPARPRRREMLDLMFSPHHDPAKATLEDEPETFASFAEAFDHYEGRVLLLGQPGAGKTITLYAQTRDAVAARLDDPTKPLPVFGIIPGWDSREQTPLVDWIAQGYTDLEAEAVRKAVEDGEALFLLDGLDELGRERPVDPTNPEGERYDPRKRFIEILALTLVS